MPTDPLIDLLSLFDRHGDRHYGEAVSQLDHALQCAACAADDKAPDSLVAAALLHDVGHLLEADKIEEGAPPTEDFQHELVAADMLSRLFGPEVVQPISLHVAAKRYLCAVEPGYLDGLSAASRHSLHLQGGPFTADQARQFEALPHWRDAVRLRRYDDEGKRVGADCPPMTSYTSLLDALRV